MLIFKLLRRYLTLGVDPPDPPDPPDGGDGGEGGDGDLGLDLGGEGGEDPPGHVDPGGEDDPDDPDALRERLKVERAARETAERTAREAQIRYEEAARSRAAAPAGGGAPRNDEERLFAQEEERLRDPKTTELERWQIESSRTLRQSRMASESALRAARDISDKNEFDRVCAKNPGLAKRYGAKVEEKLKEIRSQGGNLDRVVVLKMLIGDDAVEGRLKSAKKKDAGGEPRDGERQRDVRGAPPRARSDVSGRGGRPSERDKRMERLRDQPI